MTRCIGFSADGASLAACLVRVRAHKASNDLLSVLATPGQTPHPLFALRRIGQALGKALLLMDGHCEQ